MRYNRFTRVVVPRAKAVMFCLMDVSASMGEREKDLAKRFFILLHLFLKRKYERVDVVFIRHTHEAKEVDEHEFFYGRETGGTVVSSALEQMIEIRDKRYSPAEWNIYCAEASDGDNSGGDTEHCVELLTRGNPADDAVFRLYRDRRPRHLLPLERRRFQGAVARLRRACRSGEELRHAQGLQPRRHLSRVPRIVRASSARRAPT